MFKSLYRKRDYEIGTNLSACTLKTLSTYPWPIFPQNPWTYSPPVQSRWPCQSPIGLQPRLDKSWETWTPATSQRLMTPLSKDLGRGMPCRGLTRHTVLEIYPIVPWNILPLAAGVYPFGKVGISGTDKFSWNLPKREKSVPCTS